MAAGSGAQGSGSHCRPLCNACLIGIGAYIDGKGYLNCNSTVLQNGTFYCAL